MMQRANVRPAANGQPAIDEISERLSALANRIDAVNGPGRNTAPVPGGPSALLKKLVPTKPAAPVRRAEAAPPRVAMPAPAAPEPDGRLWPRVPVPADAVIPKLEAKIAQQAAELDRRNLLIAELTNLQQTQANETQAAAEQIAGLTQSIATLQELTTAHEAHVDAMTRQLHDSEAERVALQSQLAAEHREVNALSLRLLNIEGILNDRTVDLAASKETVADLRAQLSQAIGATAIQIAAAEERLQRRYLAERKQLADTTAQQLSALKSQAAERDWRIAELERANAELTSSNDQLAEQLEASLTEHGMAKATIASQASHIDFLDTVIKVTRDNSEATLKELVAEFDRERSQFAAKEQASSELQKNIVRLLPKLLERRAGIDTGASDAQVA